MIGREDKKANDLFYTCSLIEYIGRETKNTRGFVVDALGYVGVRKIYELAEVYHSDNIQRVAEDFIQEADIPTGNFDNVSVARYSIPSHWDMGKVYKRFILGIANEEKISPLDALPIAYHSFVSDLIQDYNSSFYYEAPQNILNAYLYNEVE